MTDSLSDSVRVVSSDPDPERCGVSLICIESGSMFTVSGEGDSADRRALAMADLDCPCRGTHRIIETEVA